MSKMLFVDSGPFKEESYSLLRYDSLVCESQKTSKQASTLSYTRRNYTSRMTGRKGSHSGGGGAMASSSVFDECLLALNVGNVSLEACISTVMRDP